MQSSMKLSINTNKWHTINCKHYNAINHENKETNCLRVKTIIFYILGYIIRVYLEVLATLESPSIFDKFITEKGLWLFVW